MISEPITSWARRHRAQLRLGLRITLASLATFAVGRLLGLTQAYWAVLTAVIVTQASIGGSLKASRDRFVGSLGGAAWGVAVSLSVPHANAWGLAAALALAIAPLALVTAINPAYRIAPVTAIILLLAPSGHSNGPLGAAFSRLMEIGLGSVVALGVALSVLPERAQAMFSRSAAEALEAMAALTESLIAEPRDPAAVAGRHQRVRKAIISAEAMALEAVRERRINLSAAADLEPLCRALRRLHNDLIMIGRASETPLDEPIRARLAEPASHTAAVVTGFLNAAARALAAGQRAPALNAVELALSSYAGAITDLRRDRLTRELPDEAVGRIFGLSFALEEMGGHLRDLADRSDELAASSRT